MTLAKENEKSNLTLILGLSVLALLIAIASSLSSVRHIFLPDGESRKILAKIFAEYGDKNFVIFKIKTDQGIEVEVFEKDMTDNVQKFKQKFSLPNDRDAYLMINSDSLNLSLIDVNKDGQLDIVCPTSDKNGNSRLNVFQYNTDLNQFVPYTEAEQ